MQNSNLSIRGWAAGFVLGVFLIAGAMIQGIPSASAQQGKAVSKPKIQCKMNVKEGKKGKMTVSWQCVNTAGWSCSLTGVEKKEAKSSVALPSGSAEMTMESGHWDITTRYSGYSCSSTYDSGRYHTSRGWCGSTSSTTPSYDSAWNQYTMKCVSSDGRIKRFSKSYFK